MKSVICMYVSLCTQLVTSVYNRIQSSKNRGGKVQNSGLVYIVHNEERTKYIASSERKEYKSR